MRCKIFVCFMYDINCEVTLSIENFASLLAKPNDLTELSKQLPLPQQRGDSTVVCIEPDLYKKELESFKTNLIGRIMLKPGSKLMRMDEVKPFF